jgi:ABC-2 type transport system permease protein
MNGYSLRRLFALLRKEWIQVRRDAMTLRIIISIPIMQLFLFGYAINSDPKTCRPGYCRAIIRNTSARLPPR